MKDYETVHSGIKSQVNNWGSWLEERTLGGDMLKSLGEEKLTYEVQVGLYITELPYDEQTAILARVFGMDETRNTQKRISDGITRITNLSFKHYRDASI